MARNRKTVFKGIPVVPGIAMGRVTLKFRKNQVFSDRAIALSEVPREIDRLTEAVRLSKVQLLEARAKVAEEIGELEATIFDAHLMILQDQGLLKKIRSQIEAELKPAEVVVSTLVEGYYQTLKKVPDEHLRERAADLRDVGRRLLDNFAELTLGERAKGFREQELPPGTVVFASELLPSDIATLERRHCEGVICELGSERGHAAVMLRAMNVPAVMGLEGLSDQIKDGDFAIVDGSTGSVYLNPRKDVLDSYKKTKQDFDHFQTQLNSEVDLPSVTTDGLHVTLLANVSKQSEIDLARLYNVEGVGLYRTEFHLMAATDFPDEEEQYQIYRDAVVRMGGKPITFRTMDIGADKKLPYLKMPDEDTHVLGRRSIRLVTDLEEFQLIQLRAILRASAHGKVKLMFPFITTLEDIRLGKRLLRSARRDLEMAKAKFDPDIPVGMMVEVPAAALSLDKFAREVQFFSVGTNDLTQYVCAADRNHADVAPWYKAHNPGMLFLLKHIVDTCETTGSELTVCGEMAGDPFYTMFLLGLGVTRFSMPAPQVPLVKKIIRSVNLTGARNLANRALQYTSTIQIRELFAHTVEQILGRDLGTWRKDDTAV